MSEREPNSIPPKPDAPEEPRDVLAADEFPGPSPDAAIVEQGPIELPDPPEGEDPEPHDVLAAEQFAMPAPRHHGDTSVEIAAPSGGGGSKAPLLAGAAAAALGALTVLLKLRSSRRRSKAERLRKRLPL